MIFGIRMNFVSSYFFENQFSLQVSSNLQVPKTVLKGTKRTLWRTVTVMNDICLLKLSADVEYNSHVQPACLPRSGDSLSDDLVLSEGKPRLNRKSLTGRATHFEARLLKSQSARKYIRRPEISNFLKNLDPHFFDLLLTRYFQK